MAAYVVGDQQPVGDGSSSRGYLDHVAGVRLDDGRQRFMRGVPEDLAMGAVVRVMLNGVEERGSVSIPPSLVSWCDPSVRCAEFVALERMPEVATVAEVPEPLMVLLAEDGAPDEVALASMLELAHADEDRLDDEALPSTRRARPEGN